MSVKTLSNVQSIAAPAPVSKARTYSIEPQLISVPTKSSIAAPAELESFLEAENPLGCFRGIMWVMIFNAAALLMGFVIWQSWKLLR